MLPGLRQDGLCHPETVSLTNGLTQAGQAPVNLVLAKKKKKSSVKTCLSCVVLLSTGYQSCREAVAAYYNCPEAPLEAQVLVSS